MKLHELLNAINEQYVVEDFGTLNFIPTKFLDAFKYSYGVMVPIDSENSGGHVRKVKYTARNPVGKNARVSAASTLKASSIKTIFSDINVFGTVVNYGEDILAVISRGADDKPSQPSYDKSKEEVYNIYFDSNKLISVATKDVPDSDPNNPQALDIFIDSLKTVSPSFAQKNANGVSTARGITQSKASVFVTNLFKLFKALALVPVLSFVTLSHDLDKIQIKNDRTESKTGVIPASMNKYELAKFNKDAKKELQQRLDLFKSGKATSVSSLEDIVDAIRTKGFLSKIKVGGFTYDMRGNNVRIDNLIANDSRNESYIDYALNTNTPEYEAYGNQRQAIWSKYDKDHSDEREAALKALDHQPQATNFKIILGLDKGSIIPVRTEKSDY